VGANVTNAVNMAGLDAIGLLSGFPQTYISRTDGLDDAPFNVTLVDGTVVPSGVYKLVLRVAKLLGEFAAGEFEEYSLGTSI